MKKKIIKYAIEMTCNTICVLITIWAILDAYVHMIELNLNTLGDLYNNSYFGGWSILAFIFAHAILVDSIDKIISKTINFVKEIKEKK